MDRRTFLALASGLLAAPLATRAAVTDDDAGRQLFMPTWYVNWCGHGQEVVSGPGADGLMALIPVLGEAS